MGREKDEIIERDERRLSAAAARGRKCERCGEVVDFDDPWFDGERLCSSCRNTMSKD